MKTKVKLFIASSSANRQLVDAFINELAAKAENDEALNLAIQPWYRDDTTRPSQDILEALIDQCQGNRENVSASDFFAAFLTPDDSTKKKGKSIEVPRDNVIFELGLFMGGLRLEPKRCFMLCSVPESALPSDLKGRTYFGFKQPEPGSSLKEKQEAVQRMAAKVWAQIAEIGPCRRGVALEYIELSELMGRERPGGRLERDSEVLVNRSLPSEEQSEDFAALVSSNIRSGITYHYFFHDLDDNGCNIIARLVHRIVSANPGKNGAPQNKPLRRDQMMTFLDLFVQRCSVSLVPSPGPIEYCIHHNARTRTANCYLTYGGKLIDWSQQDPINLMKDLKTLLPGGPRTKPLCIFRRTTIYDINHPSPEIRAKRDVLWSALKEHFGAETDSKLKLKLSKICFGAALR